MKILSKLLIILFILGFLPFSFTYWSCDSDCECFGIQTWENWFNIVNNSREVTNNNFSNFLTVEEQRAIIKKDDLNTAIMNLKRYCCKKNEWWNTADCKNYKPFFNENALDSPYLFDHLFDVIMRRLNWLDWDNDIYKKTKMSIDDLWADRRKRINSQAESINWSTPQTIYNKYNQIWNKSNPEKWFDISKQIYDGFWSNDEIFLKSIKEDKQLTNALKEYKNRTLFDRYKNSCALAEYFYALLDVWIDSKSKTQTIKRLNNSNKENNCDIIIKKQIDNENNYVQLVARKSSNLFLSNYLEWYISYMYDRQQNLQKLWKDSTDRFLDVARGVPCLQKKCK